MEPEEEGKAPPWPRPLSDKPRLHPGLSQSAEAPEEKGPIAEQGRALREAEAELERSRAAWLVQEALWAGLQELLRMPRPPEDAKALAALEEAISLAELRHSVPGLAELTPPCPVPLGERVRLLALLEEQLQHKLRQLRHFLRGEHDRVGHDGVGHDVGHDGVGHDVGHDDVGHDDVGTALQEELRDVCGAAPMREIATAAGAHRALCAKAAERCVALLRALWERRRRQEELDAERGQYLEAKGGAMLLKCRLEELTLLLDTYSPQHVDVHRHISSGLQAELRVAEEELERLRAARRAFAALGGEVLQVAAQYRALRERIHGTAWALRHLRGNQHQHTDGQLQRDGDSGSG